MKADTLTLTKVFYRPVKYQIPMFQRPYVWTQELQWEPLWEDVQALVERQMDDTEANDDIAHFLGAIVLEQIPGQTGFLETRSVIDGQQRLTTLQLFVAAARSIALEHGATRAAELLGGLIFNDDKLCATPSDRFKVRPTEFDRSAFEAAIGGVALTGKHEGQRISSAFEFFRRSIGEWVREDGSPAAERLEALNKAAWQLIECVVIDLDREDNAQIIFETLNARGTPLLAADLVKNLLFQPSSAHEPVREDLYDRYWKPLDSDHWRRDIRQGRLVRPRIDVFIMHWLTMTLRREVVIHQLYPDFRAYLKRQAGGSDAVIADLAASAAVYDRFETFPHRSHEGLFFYRLGEMDTTTALPLLLWMWGPNGLTETERSIAIRAIESWLVRRMVLRHTAKNYNGIFLTLLNRLASGEATGAAVVNYLRSLDNETGGWPDDDAFMEQLKSSPLYHSIVRRRLRMVLEALEESLGTDLSEHVSKNQLTVEHILPQQWQAHWPLPPNDDPEHLASRRDYLKHTLGNLTLITGKLNSVASNAPWHNKKDTLNHHSVLLISTDVRTAVEWDESQIEARSQRLAEQALKIWPGPDAPEWGVEPSPRPQSSAGSTGLSAGDPVAASTSSNSPPLPLAESSGDESEVGRLPPAVSELIERRSGPAVAPLVRSFAVDALSRDGVELRVQNSKNEPSYFQVRSDRLRHVVAYVNPGPNDVRIDFRLPRDHDLYGRARIRTNPDDAYAIQLYMSDQGDVDVARSLLVDALAREG
jgi:hypothetical protein